MKIKKSKITSFEYSTTMSTDEIIQLIKSHFVTRLALELKGDSVNNIEFDLDDIIVAISMGKDTAFATISYRRDQGSKPEKEAET